MKNRLFIFICLISPFIAFSQAGSFDTTFGINGKTKIWHNDGAGTTVSCFQSNGKLISGGFGDISFSRYIEFFRINIDGSLDTTFGTNGFVEKQYLDTVFDTASSNYYLFGMDVQSDDKILIMGKRESNPNLFWVVRLTPNGLLDSSFNGTGYLDIGFGTLQDIGKCVKVQPDGKIILGGTSGNTAQYFTMVRLNSNGSIDTTFGTGGKVQTSFSGTESFANSIAIQPDGKIILGGYTVNAPFAKDFAMIRYDSNGSVDATFGVNGKVITTINASYSDYIQKLIIQNDGKIIAAGTTSFEMGPQLAMVRYLSNGSLDSGFGTNGVVIANGYGLGNDVALQADGKIILVGGENADVFSVLRYLNNGTVDPAFGTNGLVSAFEDIPYSRQASSVLIQSDNKIVVSGMTGTPIGGGNYNPCSGIIRLNPGTLGIEEFTAANIKVYPNPTKDKVFFDNGSFAFTTVGVYNYLGQEVFRKSVSPLANQEVDLSGFSSGVYLLKLEGENGNGLVKVVKE